MQIYSVILAGICKNTLNLEKDKTRIYILLYNNDVSNLISSRGMTVIVSFIKVKYFRVQGLI